MSSYSEILRHPLWQKKRLTVFQRDGWCCRKCEDKDSTLQVHHLYYKPNTLPWDYPDDALITLCELCHKKAEFEKWMKTKGQASLIRLGLIEEDRHEVVGLILEKTYRNLYKDEVLQYIEDIKNQLQ